MIQFRTSKYTNEENGLLPDLLLEMDSFCCTMCYHNHRYTWSNCPDIKKCPYSHIKQDIKSSYNNMVTKQNTK